MLTASQWNLGQLLELWENSKEGQLAILDIIVNGICICVLANFHDNGIPGESRWVRRSELEKLMDYLRDKCLEYCDHPRKEALAEHDIQLLTCDSYDRVLAVQLNDVLQHLEEWNLITTNKDLIGLCAYTGLIFKWTPRQIDEASCRQLLAEVFLSSPGPSWASS